MNNSEAGASGKKNDWHNIETGPALAALASSPKGLSNAEVEKRRNKFGYNRLSSRKKKSAFQQLFSQFHNILIYVLLATAIITASLGHLLDTSVIIAVIIVNTAIGFLQERKAEKALEAISSLLSLNCHVRREDSVQKLPAEELVPGDIVILSTGEKVPADLRLIEAKELFIDEAILTGESEAVNKTTAPVRLEAVLGDRKCLGYSGTLVTAGRAHGVVIATGDATELGKIGELVSREEKITTPLIAKVESFGRVLASVIIIAALVIIPFGVFISHYTVSDMLMISAAFAVAAIPEGLPAVMTITLALGVQRMAQRNAIIRKLTAVDTLGALTTICTDKTGTLTKNEMTVHKIEVPDGAYLLSGVGYEPSGDIRSESDHRPIDSPSAALKAALIAGLLCNESELKKEKQAWIPRGNPTDVALLVAAHKAGIEPAAERNGWKHLCTFPFESKHRYMATIQKKGQETLVFVKGAPETLMAMSKADHPSALTRWREKADELAQQGYRVIAVAQKKIPHNCSFENRAQLEAGLEIIGLFAMIDPPRDGVVEAIDLCKKAGIKVKMMTGDHIGTARSIAMKLGIGRNQQALEGVELENMSSDELERCAVEIDIFARVSPVHKLKLVEALQNRNEVVGMTGDGANDAPALKRASVGIAMGIKGTEVSKESSEMVLTDDNFTSITNAIIEGRAVYDNLAKTLLFLLPTNGAQALVIVLALFTGTALPLTPVQVLWVNLVTAVTLALALVLEPPEKDIMLRRPRAPDRPLVTPFLLWRITFVSFFFSLGTFLMFLYYFSTGSTYAVSQTVAINTLVIFQIFYLFNTRFVIAPVRSLRDFTENKYILLAISLAVIFQIVLTYLPFFQNLFGTAALGVEKWLVMIMLGVMVFISIELEKSATRVYTNKKEKLNSS